ncbi:MAG: 3-oxoadipate enol-lactonase [Betaproteobacteria bacterium]|nr:MAG: 3-oxoadipate enol-lactonase [Betaproteobacteria bacterium]TMH64253.1 MAG: 3-oxoadipate enol-lactonase [Betaproteobacteria bacterium]
MPFLDLAGARFHYRIDGPAAAPVVMLSNSLGTNLAMWDSQLASLKTRYRLLRYDSRGHGESAVTSGPYTIEQLAGDALALLDALEIERANFCGLSMGGMIGQWLGAHAPRRLGKLVLANTTAKIGSPETYNARIDAVRNGGMVAITDAVLARWFTPAFLTASPIAVARVRAMLDATPPDGYVACCEAIRDMDQRETVGGIGVPTLVIAGTHDVPTPPTDARFLADRIKGARYVELPAAHLSNIEAAPAFTSALIDFIAT